jgi:hypothetical protein
MTYTPGEPGRPDLISRIASVGAPLLVVALLITRIVLRQWQSVAFLLLIFVGFVVIYAFVFRGNHDDCDGGQGNCPPSPPVE